MKRKSEEVKEEILEALWLKPLTVQEISKEIDSNWLTVEKFVNELKTEGKLKEVISTDKLTLYQKINEDTYYNLPLKKEDREMFNFIFSILLEKYNKKGKIPNKTEFAKAVVDVVKETKLNLPIVWYLYGQIPLMIADPQKHYFTSIKPNNYEQIEQISKKIVNNQNYRNTQELKLDHYEKYNNELYKIKTNLLQALKDKNSKEILNLFSQFYTACPINQDGEMFFLTDRLCAVVRKLKLLGILEEHIIDIALALDSLWRYMALNQMIHSLIKDNRYKKEELLQFYFNPVMETKKYTAKEGIQNLESIYLNNLDNFDPKSIKLSKEVQEIREIMQDWTGED